MRNEGRSIAVEDKITKYSHSQQQLECFCENKMTYTFVVLRQNDTWQCHLPRIGFSKSIICFNTAPVAQSVYRLSSGWRFRGADPGGGEISRNRPARPWGPHSLGYRDFHGGKPAGAWP